jgi:UDP-N-acetylmuramate--alanine ligase
LSDPTQPPPKSSSCRHLAPLDLWQPAHAHLVGIAGSGMRSLAHILLDIGWTVSGSDKAPVKLVELEARGARIRFGHAAENVPEATSLVVFSDAIPESNPELQRAGQRNVHTLRYFQLLGRLSSARETVAVAGTHGKSTVAAMVGAVLLGAGAEPTLAFGAEPLPMGRSNQARSRAGTGPLMVVEACEYRSNFLHFHPHQGVLLGIEPDHFDCYPSVDHLEHAFTLFARAVRADGYLLVRYECSRCRRVAQSAPCHVETFGLAAGADWQAVDIRADLGCHSFTVRYAGRDLCRIDLRVLGAHQVANALAATAIALRNRISPKQVSAELSHWCGLRRRLEIVGQCSGVTWIDDYAHHPTEVSASLCALKERFPGQRVFCIYQPHQASRTAQLLDETAASLHNADCVLITEIFRAREPSPSSGEISAADLADKTRALGIHTPPIHTVGQIKEYLAAHLQSGDVVATLGAGNIRETGNELFLRLRESRAAG